MTFLPEAALIALREGLEAFLIVGILLGFVVKLGRPDARKWVWLGLGLGIAASVMAGIFVQLVLLEAFEERGGGEWFELVAALSAVGVLTYMIVWMWKHTRSLMVGIQRKVGDALNRNTVGVVVLLTFISVVREGLEVVLFYGALAGRSRGVDLVWSGIVGVLVSVGIVVLLLRTTLHLNLQGFFAATGVLLVFIAAGLLVHSVHAATALGLLSVAPAVWDTGAFLGDDGAAGRIAHALVGYTSQPTLLQVLLYFGYAFGVGITYLHSLGFFRQRHERRLRWGRVAAVATLVVVAGVSTIVGASNAEPGHTDRDAHPEGHEHHLLPQEAGAPLDASPDLSGPTGRKTPS